MLYSLSIISNAILLFTSYIPCLAFFTMHRLCSICFSMSGLLKIPSKSFYRGQEYKKGNSHLQSTPRWCKGDVFRGPQEGPRGPVCMSWKAGGNCRKMRRKLFRAFRKCLREFLSLCFGWRAACGLESPEIRPKNGLLEHAV